MELNETELNGTELKGTEWNGTELNWTELNWTERNWTEWNWTKLNWTELNLKELNGTELNWTELNETEWNWTERNGTELNWTELNWTKLNWTKLNWTAPMPGWQPTLSWTGPGLCLTNLYIYICVCVCVCIHTYIYTYIRWIHQCEVKTAGCVTSHKYTNIQNCSAKHYRSFTKTVLQITCTHNNSSTQQQQCVCRYCLKPAVNCDFSFLMIVTLGGKLWKIVMPA